jgi:peroxiredoxin
MPLRTGPDRLLPAIFLAGLVTACAPAGSDTIAASGPGPGAFESPLVRLQQLVGENDHLHIDEVRYRADDRRLFQCGYDFGVIDANDSANMSYLAERLRHAIPGDGRRPGCIHLAVDGDTVYTVHRGNIDNPAFLSGWELLPDAENPGKLAPVQLPVLQEPGVSYEGIDVAGGLIYVALRQNGLGVYEYGESGFERIGTASGLSNAWGVRVRGTTAFVSDGLDGLAVVDVSDPRNPAVRSRVAIGGQARGLAVDGDIVYVAAGSSGLVLVDVSDLDDPAVTGRGGAIPGTAMRVDVADGYAYLAAWTDARVYDVSDPAAPAFVGAVRMTRDIRYDEKGRPPVTSRTLGIAAAGDTVLLGNWHVVYSYRLRPDRLAPNIGLPEAINLLDFGTVAAGGTGVIPVAVTNQGTAPLTVTDVRADNPAFSVEPRQMRLAPGESRAVEIRYAAADAGHATGILEFVSDDPVEPVRKGFVTASLPGLGLGKPMPEVRLNLVDGGQWTSADHQGEVMLLAYFATFCPVCSVELPELEDRFWGKYRDAGLVVAGLNPGGRGGLRGGESTDDLGGVQAFTEKMGVTFPIGLEETSNYPAFAENFRGANPFPVDIIVDRDGVIRYIAREYDPNAMSRVIEELLAE